MFKIFPTHIKPLNTDVSVHTTCIQVCTYVRFTKVLIFNTDPESSMNDEEWIGA